MYCLTLLLVMFVSALGQNYKPDITGAESGGCCLPKQLQIFERLMLGKVVNGHAKVATVRYYQNCV